MSIDTLIYTGFASNMCVIGRELGLIPIRLSRKFRLFFVPEASCAVEFKETWKSKKIHETINFIISQWFSELIDIKDLLKLETS